MCHIGHSLGSHVCYNCAMKRMILVVMLLLPCVAYAAASIKFTADTHDFGKVNEGDLLEFSFEFKNAGTDDLIIQKVKAS